MSPSAVQKPAPHTAFGRGLRAELDRRNLTVRAFAKQLRPDRPEDARRSLARWLSPDPDRAVTPGTAKRREVADALGMEPTAFDDEEEDQALREAFRLFVDLMGRIPARQIVKEPA